MWCPSGRERRRKQRRSDPLLLPLVSPPPSRPADDLPCSCGQKRSSDSSRFLLSQHSQSCPALHLLWGRGRCGWGQCRGRSASCATWLTDSVWLWPSPLFFVLFIFVCARSEHFKAESMPNMQVCGSNMPEGGSVHSTKDSHQRLHRGQTTISGLRAMVLNTQGRFWSVLSVKFHKFTKD